MKNHYDDAPLSIRRRKLILGLPGGFVLTTPLALVGCGGGGSSDGAGPATTPATTFTPLVLPAFDVTTQAVRVSLPASSGVAPETTRVVTAQNVSAVAADGTAGVLQLDAAPQMSYVFDAQGRLLLMGFIGDGATTLDAHTTAEALLYTVSRVQHQAPALQIALRETLRTHPIVDPVATAVAHAATRNGVVSDDAELMGALQAAAALLLPTPPAALAAARAKALSLRVHPDAEQSGILVVQPPAFNTIAVQNDFRRRAYAWVQQTGYIDSAGNTVLQAIPTPVADFDVSATTALNFDNLVVAVGDLLVGLASKIGLVGDYVYSQFPWTPSVSAPISLPMSPPTAKKSVYSLRVVGPGATDSSSDTMSDAENTKFWDLIAATILDDIVVPIVSTLILPAIGKSVGSAYATKLKELFAATIALDLTKIEVQRTYLANTARAIRIGDFNLALFEFCREFFGSNAWGELLKQGLVALAGTMSQAATIVRDGAGNIVAVNLVNTTTQVQTLLAGLQKVSVIKEIVEKVTVAADLVAIAHDLLGSTTLESFEVDAYALKVILTPQAAQMTIAGGTQRFTATLDAGGGGETTDPTAYTYEWSCDGTYGDLGFGDQLGHDFTTTSNVVDFVPNGTSVGGEVVTVTVKVRRINASEGGPGQSVAGAATATLTFKKQFTLQITPDSDVAADGSLGIAALINETLPDTVTVTWEWTQSGVGSIAALPADANLQDSAVTFNAGSSEGTATVTARATITGATVAVTDPVTTTLTVKKGLKTVTVHGNFACDGWVGDSAFYVRAFMVIPKVGNAASYDVTADNFFDPYYFGSSIHSTIPADGMYQGRPDFADAPGSPTNQDRGGAIWNGLSDIFGNTPTPGQDIAGAIVGMSSRFSGMRVTAVVTLKS